MENVLLDLCLLNANVKYKDSMLDNVTQYRDSLKYDNVLVRECQIVIETYSKGRKVDPYYLQSLIYRVYDKIERGELQ